MEWKLVLPLWKIVWTFLNKFKTELPNDPVILLRIFIQRKQKYYLKKTYTSPCSLQHYALFVTDKIWKKLEWLSTDEWFNSVPLSRVRLFATPWIAARQASLSITNSWSSPRLMYNESVMPSSHLILCCPLLLLPSIPPSIRVLSNESTLCIEMAKVLEFQPQPQSFQWTPKTGLL